MKQNKTSENKKQVIVKYTTSIYITYYLRLLQPVSDA